MPAYDVGITEINTQVRRLGYVSAILSILSNRTFNETLLLDRLQNWSVEHKSELAEYVNTQGEIKPTRRKTAAKRYLNFSVSLGIVGRIAGACRVTRFGKILLPFLGEKKSNNRFLLDLPERCFYLYWLLVHDSDRMMTVLDMLTKSSGQTLACYQREFQEYYLHRLDIRISAETGRIAREMLALRNRVAHEWRQPERYAESIVPPRINWLVDLGLARISMTRGTPAELTPEGVRLTNELPQLDSSDIHDVKPIWLRQAFFTTASHLFGYEGKIEWQSMAWTDKKTLLDSLIPNTFSTLRSTPARKVTLFPALFHMALHLAETHHIWANMEEIQVDLEQHSKEVDSRYEVRFSHRENESYLIAKPL